MLLFYDRLYWNQYKWYQLNKMALFFINTISPIFFIQNIVLFSWETKHASLIPVAFKYKRSEKVITFSWCNFNRQYFYVMSRLQTACKIKTILTFLADKCELGKNKNLTFSTFFVGERRVDRFILCTCLL